MVRKKYSALISLCCIMSLSFIFCLGISIFLDHWKAVPPVQTSGIPLGDRGLILTNALSKNETAVVLLRGTDDPFGPRVTAIPGQPLAYSRAASGNYTLPPVPFADDTPWFLRSLSIDIRLNAEIFAQKLNEGFYSFFIYTFSFIFLLCSIAFAMKFSVWPLANLFLAALAFRGILSLKTFISTPEMQEIIGTFIKNMIPAAYMLPIFFLGLGTLLSVFSFLNYLAKRRFEDDY